ncbi:MAG: hypothetical protein ACXADY_06565 [Candidatus Hodarchaeales archaeon]|jgi:hypothetical protein
MKIKTRKLEVFLVVIIAFNLVIFHSSLFFTSSASESTFASLKNTSDFQNATILTPGIPQTKFFTNESLSHYWILKTDILGQVVYFSIDPHPSFSTSDFQVTLYDPSGIQIPLDPSPPSNRYLGSWTASRIGNWTIQVNNTSADQSGDFSYEILASIPITGYSDDSALSLSESNKIANFTIDHEVHYWKVSLDENQNCTVFLTEITSSVLIGAEVVIYSKELGKGNPVPVEGKYSGPLGLYNYSWNAFAQDDYIIEISHKTEYTGFYNISFLAQPDLYNFLTAGRLPYNKTISVCEIHSYISQKKYYFWFMVNSSRSEINIIIYADNPTLNKILDFSSVEIYDKGFQDPILTAQEYRSTQDGEINITIVLDEGKYYLVILPKSETKGSFFIHFEYTLSKPFTWNLSYLFLSLVILVVLPGYLIYLDSKGKWYRGNQWSVPTSLQETFKFIKSSFHGIFTIKEVPNKSILIRVVNIPFKTFLLLNFIESSEEETLIISKRLLRRIDWLIYILISLVIFDILNLLSFSFFSIHFLPVYISNSTLLFLVLAIPTTIVGIIVLFVTISSYISYNQVVNRIAYSVQNYQKSLDNVINHKDLDPEQAFKSINYVRVLWNQAKRAFKDDNFELFVIKADAAVKNLLSTRFQQLVPNPTSKPDFKFQVATLRKHGFDLPSEKRIAHFRNLRNRIVHSSFTLDEKESVDCFAYYSTFITRLGLRSG